MSSGKIDESSDKPHQENCTQFLNLCDHQHKGNACKHSDKARHQHPKNRVNTSQKHEGKVDDKVDCGKDTDGNKVFSFQFLSVLTSDIENSSFG